MYMGIFFRHEKAHALLLANSSPCGIPALRDPLRGIPQGKDGVPLIAEPPGSSGKSQLKAYSWFVEKKDSHAHLFLLKINT
jgi:hypothetical protein